MSQEEEDIKVNVGNYLSSTGEEEVRKKKLCLKAGCEVRNLVSIFLSNGRYFANKK